jgi:hypothetical protein
MDRTPRQHPDRVQAQTASHGKNGLKDATGPKSVHVGADQGLRRIWRVRCAIVVTTERPTRASARGKCLLHVCNQVVD